MKVEYVEVVALPAAESAEYGKVYPRITRRTEGTLYSPKLFPAAVVAAVFVLRAGRDGPRWHRIADNSMRRLPDDAAGMESCRAWLAAFGV